MTQFTALLFGQTACDNEARLQRLLQTDWRVMTLPDEGNIAVLREALGEATAVISLGWKAEWSEAATSLRLIQAPGAGVDAFDVSALPRGCSLCNVYEHATPIAEYTIGALVALTTGMLWRDRSLRKGSWEGTGRRDGVPHDELFGSSLGLIGYGTIGREIAVRANALGMRVRAVRSRAVAEQQEPLLEWLGGPERLRELLTTSDHVVVCCPLTSTTRGLLNAERLSWLKPTAHLVNVARAEVADEQALFDLLRSRQIAGAALDVWYRYPTSGRDILLPATAPFHELENVIMTPHLSAWTHAMIERRWTKMAANLDALAAGRPLQNIVAPVLADST